MIQKLEKATLLRAPLAVVFRSLYYSITQQMPSTYSAIQHRRIHFNFHLLSTRHDEMPGYLIEVSYTFIRNPSTRQSKLTAGCQDTHTYTHTWTSGRSGMAFSFCLISLSRPHLFLSPLFLFYITTPKTAGICLHPGPATATHIYKKYPHRPHGLFRKMGGEERNVEGSSLITRVYIFFI